MANYLVTGGAGFIGGALIGRLIGEGHSVWTIDNLKTGYRENIHPDARFIEGDFSRDEVLSQLGEEHFEAVFHIGGQSSGEISFDDPEYDLNTNTLSTLKLLQYCLKTGCSRFVYASSMSVYGEEKGKECYSEEDRTEPLSFYAVGKLASEKYLEIFSRQFGITYTALRYFNVYGPGQNLENLRQGMVSIYLKQFLDSSFETVEVKGSTDRFRDLVYIDDIIDITLSTVREAGFENRVLNVGTGVKTTVGDILRTIREKLNSSKEVVVTAGTPGDQFGIYADTAELSAIYKRAMTPFDEGVSKMIDWINDEPR